MLIVNGEGIPHDSASRALPRPSLILYVTCKPEIGSQQPSQEVDSAALPSRRLLAVQEACATAQAVPLQHARPAAIVVADARAEFGASVCRGCCSRAGRRGGSGGYKCLRCCQRPNCLFHHSDFSIKDVGAFWPTISAFEPSSHGVTPGRSGASVFGHSCACSCTRLAVTKSAPQRLSRASPFPSESSSSATESAPQRLGGSAPSTPRPHNLMISSSAAQPPTPHPFLRCGLGGPAPLVAARRGTRCRTAPAAPRVSSPAASAGPTAVGGGGGGAAEPAVTEPETSPPSKTTAFGWTK
jgi:hypothetical protein